jgi:hypothetical protein
MARMTPEEMSRAYRADCTYSRQGNRIVNLVTNEVIECKPRPSHIPSHTPGKGINEAKRWIRESKGDSNKPFSYTIR